MGTNTVDLPVGYWHPTSEADRRAVREQLERVLASPLFSISKRYPALLRYVVEESLKGRGENLKERTLGIDVFKRDSHYDTNADPVVRVTAGEVRKRLAQYYYEQGHAYEVHIELPSGSYVPVYRIPDPQLRAHADQLHQGQQHQAQLHQAAFVPEHTEAPPVVVAQAPPAAVEIPAPPAVGKWRTARIWLSAAAICVLVAAAAYFLTIRLNRAAHQEALNEFWMPVVSSPDTALLCLGDRASWDSSRAAAVPADDSSENLTVGQYLDNQGHVMMTDVVTMNRLASTLQTLGKQYRIKNSSETDLSDLRSGPVILIGGGNNSWTLRVTAPLRFSFAMDSIGGRIIDKRNPTQTSWVVPLSTPYRQLSEDYGIVARLKDPTTDRLVVVAAGLAAQGTIAAGEMLSNPDYLKSLFAHAPDGWQHKNMEAVIATEVINGEPGPPRVLAIEYW